MRLHENTLFDLFPWPRNVAQLPFFAQIVSQILPTELQLDKATPTLVEYLNKAWSWPERQERSGSVAEAPMLTMPK